MHFLFGLKLELQSDPKVRGSEINFIIKNILNFFELTIPTWYVSEIGILYFSSDLLYSAK